MRGVEGPVTAGTGAQGAASARQSGHRPQFFLAHAHGHPLSQPAREVRQVDGPVPTLPTLVRGRGEGSGGLHPARRDGQRRTTQYQLDDDSGTETRPVYLISDKAYDSDAIRDIFKPRSSGSSPPATTKRQSAGTNTSFGERNRVEPMIGHLKFYRASATRYNKLARFLDCPHDLAVIRKCLRCGTL